MKKFSLRTKTNGVYFGDVRLKSKLEAIAFVAEMSGVCLKHIKYSFDWLDELKKNDVYIFIDGELLT